MQRIPLHDIQAQPRLPDSDGNVLNAVPVTND